MIEIWKDIEGYEGTYQISNLGRVKNLRWKGGYIKVNQLRGKGYFMVLLNKNKSVKLKYVHKLVAEAFIPNPENKPCVDHINTIKTDNRAENLKWVTYKENSNNPITTNRMSESGKKRKPISEVTKEKMRNYYRNTAYKYLSQPKPVRCLETGVVYKSEKEAEQITGIKAKYISRVCSGVRKSCMGTHWKFVNN